MTPESRVRKSINALRSESAWTPMPEHILFIQTKPRPDIKKQTKNINIRKYETRPTTVDEYKSDINTDIEEAIPSPKLLRAETEVINKCNVCDMIFRTEAMLTYHKAAFCVGKPIDEHAPIPDSVLSEYSTMDSFADRAPTSKSDDVTGDGIIQSNNKNIQCPAWCRDKDGSVPPSAVKVTETNTDHEPSYVCMVQVGDERLPGTLQPSKKRATCSVNGDVYNVAEYDVLVDPNGQLSWRDSPVVGGIPRDAVLGGYDYNNLQYYVARGKAPDGTLCCGQYIPHKQKCYFAYDEMEYSTTHFHFLCKKYSSTEIAMLDKRAPKSTADGT